MQDHHQQKFWGQKVMYFSGDVFSKSDLNCFHFCVSDSKQTLWKNVVRIIFPFFSSVEKNNNFGIILFYCSKPRKIFKNCVWSRANLFPEETEKKIVFKKKINRFYTGEKMYFEKKAVLSSTQVFFSSCEMFKIKKMNKNSSQVTNTGASVYVCVWVNCLLWDTST